MFKELADLSRTYGNLRHFFRNDVLPMQPFTALTFQVSLACFPETSFPSTVEYRLKGATNSIPTWIQLSICVCLKGLTWPVNIVICFFSLRLKLLQEVVELRPCKGLHLSIPTNTLFKRKVVCPLRRTIPTLDRVYIFSFLEGFRRTFMNMSD